ncbi:MAG: undecaprenyl-diphosphate phosphatase [Pseudomonadales bacterium]|nr:undecaprenyl-diphosphate phosphatase [Pseudomonadales bacterium]MBO6597533.1 undecaprenyl-diphosphate phosphatase [Pseudomonadales bacterium]MBO6824417.1 undecaprenyl-diphosphate phosphatase [Pseudomonadales bacterium]
MDVLQAVVLALVQGITEFLPISSSAHLILPGKLLGWPDQGLAFDTAVHLGSLFAVLIYFRGQLRELLLAMHRHVTTGESSDASRLAYNVVIASLPIIPIGYLSRFVIEAELRSLGVIAATTLVFGIALGAADHFRKQASRPLTPMSAFAIGIAQCFALIPGTSRSGVTMTMALLLGQSRTEAARFSFLIAIPTIAGAAALKLWDITHHPAAIQWSELLIGIAVAGTSAYACIAWLLAVIEKVGYLPFVIYRMILGIILLLMIV